MQTGSRSGYSTLMDLAAAGRRIVLFTLAEEPPSVPDPEIPLTA